MRRAFAIAASTVLAVASLCIGASLAAGATEFGSSCSGQSTQLGVGIVQLRLEGAPATSPLGGVLTTWTIQNGTSQTLTQRLEVLRPAAGFKFQVVAVSEFEAVPPGPSTFGTRLTIAPGDEIGVSGKAGSAVVYCAGLTEGEEFALFEPGTPVGSLSSGSEATKEFALPVRARIEPDADHDGFGDETQDACPTDPLLQTACPSVGTPGGGNGGSGGTGGSAGGTGGSGPSAPTSPTPIPHPFAIAAAHKGSVSVKVRSDVAASVAVRGRVALGGGASVTPHAAAKSVSQGGTASFTLKFPRALTEALAALPRQRKLTLHITVTAATPAGQVGTDALTVKLRGRGGT